MAKDHDDLKAIVEREIAKYGKKCDLNHIDVSNVTNMQRMFMGSKFNGDISRWNVSNVMEINDVFEKCDFEGNIMSWKLNER